jgi:NAD/NADP transhydrogenase alpha subunit
MNKAEKCLRIIGFSGLVIIDTVVFIGIMFPVSMVEMAVNRELGSYNATKAMWDFTIQVGTGEC